jgi:hypothetical protein
MPLQETSGNVTADAYGGGVAAVPNYIEDVFSTWLTTGTGTSNTQTVNNGVNLSTYGGLVWGKSRNIAGSNHILVDTARGVNTTLSTDNTGAQITSFPTVSSFLSNGFTATNYVNSLSDTFAFWTFRKQPKFFDVVTWTGNGDGTGPKAKPHSLASVPGCIIVKRTSSTGSWAVYQRATSATPWNDVGVLNGTDAWYIGAGSGFFGAAPTSTDFYVNDNLNQVGATYVAYLFAHNAGGFGLTGTDNVISCGSFTAGTGEVNLGYEPQWIMFKSPSTTGGWIMFDTMRGWVNSPDIGGTRLLQANTSGAEGATGLTTFQPTATGFKYNLIDDYIYIAIRRGPMKVPTDATKVFSPLAVNNATSTTNTTNFPVDMQISNYRGGESHFVVDRLRGVSSNSTEAATWLVTNGTGAEVATGAGAEMSLAFDNTSFKTVSYYSLVGIAYWNFRRAPSFFDEVCYTGTGVARTLSHNLAAVPELMIIKDRTTTGQWAVYHGALGNTKVVILNSANPQATTSAFWNNTSPTSSVFTVGTDNSVNTSGDKYVAYLFSTCAGVSKVGSYTGTGATQTINCGFSGGARFVLIKRYDSTGSSWFVFDTARGMVSGTDPALRLNSTAAETNADWCFTTATGFQLATSDASVNGSGSNYIYLAIA